MAKRLEAEMPYSKVVLAICKLLEKEGYINQVKDEDHKIIVTLRYSGKQAALMDVKRVSKPGLRIYSGRNTLPRVLNGMGVAIISTPKGIMTDKQARKEGLGGEVMAYVW